MLCKQSRSDGRHYLSYRQKHSLACTFDPLYHFIITYRMRTILEWWEKSEKITHPLFSSPNTSSKWRHKHSHLHHPAEVQNLPTHTPSKGHPASPFLLKAAIPREIRSKLCDYTLTHPKCLQQQVQLNHLSAKSATIQCVSPIHCLSWGESASKKCQ